MINEEKCFTITCDNCGELYQNDHSGFSLFVDENNAVEDMDNTGWHTDGKKHYCPNCYIIDDNDNLIIKPNQQGTVSTNN